ncbi:MAG: YceH family protein [Bryobacteraceae bacterium]
MDLLLSPEECRVLGVLIEKDMATPDYYPMSLNALVNGCNQKTNRDPIVSYDEETVQMALDLLRDRTLSTVLTGGSNRVPKYGHRVSETLDLNNREMAVIGVLLLRGAQTLNEIRSRTESLYRFDDLDAVETVLHKLGERGMTVLLPKLAGMREPRWMHKLAGEVSAEAALAHAPAEVSSPVREGLAERVTQLEIEVEQLKAMFAEFRKQLE